MKVELRTITPQIAKRILETNPGNRPVNKAHVKQLAKEMEEGRWKINGDTICVNENRLIDGQHRLHAVVMSGITIQTLVVEGLPADVFDTIDVGKRRSPGDTLAANGEKNGSRLAASLRWIDKYMTGRVGKSVNYSNTEIEVLLDKYPEARDSVLCKYKGKGLITPALLDACHYLFSKKDRDRADRFIERLVRGFNLRSTDPVYILRERLLNNSLSKSKLSNPYIFALCIKAWNAEREGKEIKTLRYTEEGESPEKFPIIQ